MVSRPSTRELAHKTFDHLQWLQMSAALAVPATTAAYNALIRAHASTATPLMALKAYKSMLSCSHMLCPDVKTFPFLLAACARATDLVAGTSVLAQAVERGCLADVYVTNAAIHMFAVCERADDARKLFDCCPVKDVVSWNTMMNGYVLCGRPDEGLDMFWAMRGKKLKLDSVTMIAAVAACARIKDLDLGARLHRIAKDEGVRMTVPLSNAIMDMYIKCGCLKRAEEAFQQMAVKSAVSCATMVAGYVQFGMLEDARMVLQMAPEKNTVAWNALLVGYAQNDKAKEAMVLFYEMQADGVKPDAVTMVGLLMACTQLGALEKGMWAHRYIERRCMFITPALGTVLVDMYAKCGNIEKAVLAFRQVPVRTVHTWTAMICGLAAHGHALEAIDYFREMLDLGLEPDGVTFVGVLSGCCHAGLVDDGREFFDQISSKYGLPRSSKHYACMVDLLGRSGRLAEAMELMKEMPTEPDIAVWGALFFACRLHRNVPMGAEAAVKLLELDPDDAGIYVQLAGLYREANMKKEADEVWSLLRRLDMEKTPGCSSVEVNGAVHEFIAGDSSSLLGPDIQQCLELLTAHMRILNQDPDPDSNG